MKILILIFSLILSLTNVNAGITDRNEYFTSSCEEQLGVALVWKDYAWHKARVGDEYLSKFIAKKIQSRMRDGIETNSKAGACGYELDEEYFSKYQKVMLKNKQKDWENNKLVAIWDACYNIRRFGDSFYEDDTKICSETWINKSGKYSLKYVNSLSERLRNVSFINPAVFL